MPPMPPHTDRPDRSARTADRAADRASALMDAVPFREVIPHDPRTSFRAFTHDYPSPIAGWQYHPELEIHLITKSTGTVIAGDHVGSFAPGQVILLGSGLPHDWVSDVPPGVVFEDRDYVIQFEASWLRSCQAVMPELAELDRLVTGSGRGLLYGGATAERAAIAIRDVVHGRGPARVARMIELLTLLDQAPPGESQPLAGEWFVNPDDRNRSSAVEAGLAYIFENLEGDVSLSHAARLAHMSDSAFSRYFKSASGLTFSAMVRKLRIANACRLLDAGDLPISAIAATTGYRNLANFNRQFLAETGMTPREYRRSHVTRSGYTLLPPGAASRTGVAATSEG